MSLEWEQEPEAAAKAVVQATPASPAAAAVLTPRGTARGPAADLAARTARVAQLQAAATQVVPYLQYQVARLGPAGQAGLATLVAALIFAASTLVPARHALESLNAEILRAQHSSVVQSPDEAVPRLVESLPIRTQIPAVLGLILTQARESNVSLDVGHYAFSPPKSGALARYDMEFPVKASYLDIRNFINKTLAAVPAAALGKLHVERKTVGEQAVSADIGFVIFVRSE